MTKRYIRGISIALLLSIACYLFYTMLYQSPSSVLPAEHAVAEPTIDEVGQDTEGDDFVSIVEPPQHIAVEVEDVDIVLEQEPITDQQKNIMALLAQKAQNEVVSDLLDDTIPTDAETLAVKEIYTTLKNSYQQKVAEKVPVENLATDEARRVITFTIHTYDSMGTPLDGVNIMLWGGLLGRTDANGELITDVHVPHDVDILPFEARKLQYTPGFARKEMFYDTASHHDLSFTLSSKNNKVTKTSATDIQIDDARLEISMTDACAVVDAQGACVDGDVFVEHTYIEPRDLNDISIPMQAIVDGDVMTIVSNGMAFANIYSQEGEILFSNNASSKICYTVDEEDIDSRKRRETAGGEMDGYRWFDRSIGYWKFDPTAKITLEGNKRCAETTHAIY